MANLRLSESNSSSLENCRARANYQNLILASKREVKSGAQMWHVYQHENGAKVAESEFYFALPYKALRYAFMLRKRTGAIIPKAVYNKLMADVSASKAQAEPSAESESVPQEESHTQERKEREQVIISLTGGRAFADTKGAPTRSRLLSFHIGTFAATFVTDRIKRINISQIG